MRWKEEKSEDSLDEEDRGCLVEDLYPLGGEVCEKVDSVAVIRKR